jgi:nitrous oxide reductase accessory protein NosL
MKRLSVLMIGIIFFSILLSACGQSQDEINATAPIYKVTQSTGLYSALKIDADQIAVLPVGAILVPADEETTLFCDKFIEAGMKYALCKVEVFDTGQTGWVLEMFVEKN